MKPVVPLASLLAFSTLHAAVRLPAVISDHMVLQQGVEAPVWGWADAGEAVTVSFAGQTRGTKAGADGKWSVKLPALPARAEAAVLTVKGANEIKVEDVLVGEVWLCSGQSNMAMTVGGSKDADAEKAAANFPGIRMFTVSSNTALTPQDDCKGSWKVCSPDTVSGFSAAGYFFGRDLHQNLSVPVGLMHSSVGGTPVESWTSLEIQKDKPELAKLHEEWARDVALYDAPESKGKREEAVAKWKVQAEKLKAEGKNPGRAPEGPGRPALSNHRPGNLYNGKIAPLIPYALKGAIWYQGESNANPAERADLYAFMFPLMIQDWRARWNQGDFPFAWVQLVNYQKRATDPMPAENWPVLRNSQTRSLSLPHTGMTVNMDIGEENDIHPKNKQDIGKRLALWARANVYGQSVAWSGPVKDSVSLNGKTATVTFRHAEGLKTTDGAAPKGFTVATADRAWAWANATLDNGKVVLAHPTGADIAAVRYAWANNPEVNLVNAAGLPTAPFRSDDWPLYAPTPAPAPK